MTIHLLVCDYFSDEMPEWEPCFPNFFVRLFDGTAPGRHSFIIYNVEAGELPQELRRDELYVITGARASANDAWAWIDGLRNLIRRAESGRVPLAGICFGHQLIAQALGGRVERAEVGWGVGIRRSRIVASGMARACGGEELRLFCNHHDQVTALPPRARLLATSRFCPVEAFSIGSHILCFQGHPEYTARYMLHVIGRATGEPAATIAQAIETTKRDDAMGSAVAGMILALGQTKDPSRNPNR